MKRFFHPLALAALMLGVLAMGSLTSCKKDPLDEFNPKTDTIAEAPFSLKGKETRSDGTYVLPWTISKGGVMDSELEELDELAITPFNTFTFEAVPESASATFPGINAKTDNACIKLERKGQNGFSISYVSDGDATIKVWNGNESGNTAVTFKVQARKTIPVEGLLVRIDDKEDVLINVIGGQYSAELHDKQKEFPFYNVKYLSRDKVTESCETIEEMYSFYDREDLNLHKLEILHIQPENTTVRRLNFSNIAYGHPGVVSNIFCKGEFQWFNNVSGGHNYNIPNGTDVSILHGKSIFFCAEAGVNPNIVMDYYCPPGHYFLMQTKVADGTRADSAGKLWAISNSVKIIP